MNVRPLSPDSGRKMPACPALVLRRTFAVLALPGCALAVAPDSIAADTWFAPDTDPLSSGEGIVARPPGAFEVGAHAGALEGVALPLHPDWEVILAGGRGDDDAESTLSHRITSRYRLNESLALRASWHGDLLASGRTAPDTARAMGDVRPCNSRPRAGGPDRCDRFRAERVGGGGSTLRPRDAGTFRVGAETRAGPLFVSLDWFRVGLSETPASSTGHSAVDVEAWGTSSPGAAVRRGRDIVTRIASHAGGGESELAGIDVHARTGWRSRGADFALDTRWLHLTGREDRLAGDSQWGSFPRNHVHASLRADRSGFSAGWKVRTASGFWDNLRNTRYAAWIRHDITFRKRDAFGFRGVDLVGGVLNLRNRGSSTDPRATSAAGATEKPNPAPGRTLFLSARLSLDS